MCGWVFRGAGIRHSLPPLAPVLTYHSGGLEIRLDALKTRHDVPVFSNFTPRCSLVRYV